MKEFKHMPQSSICPVCKVEGDTSSCYLIPIAGTVDGNIEEALAVHTKCISEIMAEKAIIMENRKVMIIPLEEY